MGWIFYSLQNGKDVIFYSYSFSRRVCKEATSYFMMVGVHICSFNCIVLLSCCCIQCITLKQKSVLQNQLIPFAYFLFLSISSLLYLSSRLIGLFKFTQSWTLLSDIFEHSMIKVPWCILHLGEYRKFTFQVLWSYVAPWL